VQILRKHLSQQVFGPLVAFEISRAHIINTLATHQQHTSNTLPDGSRDIPCISNTH